MENRPVYLKSMVQIEPLINQWHAYPFTVAPATFAMNTSNFQLKVMNSYVKMPMAHAAALKNPDMVGGAFIDYNGGRVSEIKELKERTETKYKHLIDFAKAYGDFKKELAAKANGLPLGEMYEKIPEPIKGYVELVYDIDNKPGVRFIEPLLYKSPYFDISAQSIALSLVAGDDRPFIFSTPRLKDANIVHLPIAFNNSLIDELVEMKRTPMLRADIFEKFSIAQDQQSTFENFLTDQAPKPIEQYTGDDVRVRYFGHACVLLQTKNVTVLTDPLISYRYDTPLERFTYEDLPEVIDYVVITHAHHDHIVIETLLQLRSRIKTIIVPKNGGGFLEDPSMKLILKNIGFQDVIEIDELEEVGNKDVRITGLPFFGEHCDLNIRSKSTYLVKFPTSSFLMTADSSILEKEIYLNVQKTVGNVDALFIGMECTGAPMSWSYGAFLTEPVDNKLDKVRRSNGSNCDAAMLMAEIFGCKHVFLYAMGSEPWLNYFMALQHAHSNATDIESQKLLDICLEKNIHAEKLFAKRQLFF